MEGRMTPVFPRVVYLLILLSIAFSVAVVSAADWCSIEISSDHIASDLDAVSSPERCELICDHDPSERVAPQPTVWKCKWKINFTECNHLSSEILKNARTTNASFPLLHQANVADAAAKPTDAVPWPWSFSIEICGNMGIEELQPFFFGQFYHVKVFRLGTNKTKETPVIIYLINVI